MEKGHAYVNHVVTGFLLRPLKRHINYWWSFHKNVRSLRNETRHLKRASLDMDQFIEDFRYLDESASPGVRDWSSQGTQMLEEADIVLRGCDEVKPWNIIKRYKVGKSAKKTAQVILKLWNEAESTTQNLYELAEFESRRRVEEDIIESLKDHNVQMIAVCGPGGVGKTTMVQRIEKRVRDKLFNEVVKVVVSHPVDMLNIQKEIAEILGVDLGETTTLADRAHFIRTRLLDSTTKLIVFEDVWESFNLSEIGVPLGHYGLGGCRIILTSRNKDVCGEMNSDKFFQIHFLDDEESWRLFRQKSGVSEYDSIAKAVAAECKGLPIALVHIAKALTNKDMRIWEDSLEQLKRADPTNFPILDHVYMSLKLSYDFLETESERYVFLLCCLFPEDYDIPIELLTLYSIGLGILEEIRNIDEGRNRTHHLVERLKSRFLLIDGRSCAYVKMHDVVRDVAIFIGSKEKHGFLKSMEVSTIRSSSKDSSLNCNWMSIDFSSIENAKLLVGSDFPNLCLLIIQGSYSSPLVFDAEVICLEGMGELSVLAFSNINIKSLPPTLGSLKKLTTLHLENSTVEDISIVGELTSLEILCIRGCDNIQVLSADIGRLNRLRFLELNDCSRVERVVAGVISNLVELEELKIIGSFDKWEAKGNKSEEGNASLSELESLPNLSCLEIDISDQDLVSQEICLMSFAGRSYGLNVLNQQKILLISNEILLNVIY